MYQVVTAANNCGAVNKQSQGKLRKAVGKLHTSFFSQLFSSVTFQSYLALYVFTPHSNTKMYYPKRRKIIVNDDDDGDEDIKPETTAKQASAAKRAELFNELQAEEAPRLEARHVKCAENLDAFELKECYKIAEDAIMAISQNYRASPDVMEAFLELVFKNWTSTKVADVAPLQAFPTESPIRVGSIKTPVGRMIGGKLHWH